MSIALTNAPTFGGLFARVFAALGTLAESRARRAAYNQTRRELGRLSDRELTDIGLSRASIDNVAAEACKGYGN
jgi:uncharacterized protein YjiS (DUF1127 family)